MKRALLIGAILALTPSAAEARFIGVEIREDFFLNDAASAAIGQDARVLRLFARFDSPGLIGEDPATTPDPNELTAVSNLANGATTLALARGQFYQDVAFGTHFPPNPPGIITVAPSVIYDSYVSIGRLVDEPTDLADDSTAVTSDFDWSNPTEIVGAWFNSRTGLNEAGTATLDSFGRFTVFIGQFTVIGVGRTPTGENDLILGFDTFPAPSVLFAVRDPNELAIQGAPVLVTVTPASPSIALFGVVGLTLARRRRRSG